MPAKPKTTPRGRAAALPADPSPDPALSTDKSTQRTYIQDLINSTAQGQSDLLAMSAEYKKRRDELGQLHQEIQSLTSKLGTDQKKIAELLANLPGVA